jgi:hypothetical protein
MDFSVSQHLFRIMTDPAEVLNCRHTDAHNSSMEHARSVSDAQPFLDSLRRVYHEQLAKSVSDAVAVYHSQMCRLEVTWTPEGTTPGGSSSFLIDDEFA